MKITKFSVTQVKKIVGKFKIETHKKFWIDQFIAWRSKGYSYKFGDENTKKLKGNSKSYSKKNLKMKNMKMFR